MGEVGDMGKRGPQSCKCEDVVPMLIARTQLTFLSISSFTKRLPAPLEERHLSASFTNRDFVGD